MKTDKVKSHIKNHFVEYVGFLCIFVIIIFVFFLKYYRKTFVCESTKVIDGIKVYEKYTVKQKNNHLKSIDYFYRADLSKISKKEISSFYEEMLKTIAFDDNDEVNLKLKNNKLLLSYTLKESDFKGNVAYKSTRTFLKNVKRNDFKCK